MARRREVKKKRKAVEKEVTKKMFADFEGGVSKEEARREARREAREEARSQKCSEDKCEGGAAADPEL